MTWLTVAFVIVLVWAILENYWRRHYAERSRAWQKIAGGAMKERAEMRDRVRSEQRLVHHRRSRS